MLKGEDGSRTRALKWSNDTVTASISADEECVLEEYLYSKFSCSGIDICPQDVSPYHYPADTSPGLPYIQYGIKRKDEVAAVYSMHDLIEAGRIQTERGDAPMFEFAKVEPTKKHKAVRTIMCYPFHVHCYLLSYLLSFSELVKSLKHSAIGWSKWRCGVNDLCDRMKAAYICEVDARAFDSTLPNCLVELALRVYFSLFTNISAEEASSIIRTIISGLVFSSSGEVYFKPGGNSSGSPITTELNTVVHILLFLLAYYRKFGTTDGFDDYFKQFYGDDVFWETDGDLMPSDLIKYLSDMPVKYPEESIKINHSPEGLTFLGCTFYKKEGCPFWLWRPAKPKKMLATLKYCEKNDHYVELGLELSRVRGILLDCAWDQQLWNLLYPYQLVLEAAGASEGVVGRRVNRDFVQWLTFGI